jgi:hypothetical protein
MAILFLGHDLAAEETNHTSAPAPCHRLRVPSLDDAAVKGVSISPGVSLPSDVGGQGPVSLDTPGSTFSASVPLPAGGTSSNKGEFVAAPIPFLSPAIGFGIGLGAAYIYSPPFAGTNAAVDHRHRRLLQRQRKLGRGATMNWNEDCDVSSASRPTPTCDTISSSATAPVMPDNPSRFDRPCQAAWWNCCAVGQRWYVGGRGLRAEGTSAAAISVFHLPSLPSRSNSTRNSPPWPAPPA